MSQMTDTLENSLADFLFRGQAFTAPTTLHIALCTTAPTDATPGTEVTGGSYARATIASSLANWSGTQGAGTTVASTGTGGQISNNVAITFAAPTAAWGIVTHFEVWTGAVGSGTRLFYGTLTTPRTINSGDAAPSFGAGALTVTLA